MQDVSDPAVRWRVPVAEAAAVDGAHVLAMLGTGAAGLDVEETARRRAAVGPNAVRTHHAPPLRVLGRQLRSPVLIGPQPRRRGHRHRVHRRAARFSVGRQATRPATRDLGVIRIPEPAALARK